MKDPWRSPAADAKAQAQRGLTDAAYLRDLVLAHQDLAERLTAPPLDCPTPAHWNGYIPPLMTCAAGGQRNESPQRAALIEICGDAMVRELGEEAAAAWKWTTG